MRGDVIQMDHKHRESKIFKRHFIVALFSLLLIAPVIGGIVWNKLKIDEPIYFRYLVEHYLPTISDSTVVNHNLELIYVQDITDDKDVTEVRFINHPELNVLVLSNFEEKYGIYKLKNVTLYLEWDQSAIDVLPETAEVNGIQVTYSDNSSQEVDIGRICIYSGMSDKQLLEAVDAVPLWGLERVQTYKTNDTLIIDGLSEITREYLNMADIIQSYSLKGNNIEITDVSGAVKLERNGELEFNMQLKDFDRKRFIDLNSNYDYYQIRPQLIYHKESGERYFTDIYNHPVTIRFDNYRDARNYVKRRTSNQ